MTSLAHQLKRLALPQSDPSLLSRKEVASLLFDPQDAATMDRSTFYALGRLSIPSDLSRHWSLVQPLSVIPLFLLQAAQDWRSCWVLNRPSWNFRRRCSVALHWQWSGAFSPEKWIRSWTATSRSSSLAFVRTSSSNLLTSAWSGWFTGTTPAFQCWSKMAHICFFNIILIRLWMREIPPKFCLFNCSFFFQVSLPLKFPQDQFPVCKMINCSCVAVFTSIDTTLTACWPARCRTTTPTCSSACCSSSTSVTPPTAGTGCTAFRNQACHCPKEPW